MQRQAGPRPRQHEHDKVVGDDNHGDGCDGGYKPADVVPLVGVAGEICL